MYKVMLVDDMDITLRQIKRMELWNGETDFCIAAEARNGQEALDILKNERIDLLITDIKMPKVDGIELLKEVSENDLCPCVVLLSDYEDFTYARQGIQYGAFDYLGKPAKYEDMANMLARAKHFLDKKRRESGMIISLTEMLEEVEQLVEAFVKKSIDISRITGRLIETILALYGSDIIKTGTAFKRVMSEFLQRLNLCYGWLEKFIDLEKYKEIDFAGMGDVKMAADAFSGAVSKLFGEIGLLVYGNDPAQLEYRISRLVLEEVDDNISIEKISSSLFLNRKYLSEAFRQKTGELLIEYITRIKMKRAALLLGQSGKKTYEIAFLLGYKDAEYFSRLFKKYMGASPSEYKNSADK